MIGWGILGNARIARLAVAPAIANSANGKIAAIGSRSLERAKELTDQLGGHPVEGYEAVLTHPDVDVVYVPLPNHLHKPWVLKALAAGKHVLVEKPIAMNATEAAEMFAAAKGADRLLMEAFMWRFHPRAQKIKQIVKSGELGKIGSIRAAFTFPVEPNENNVRLFSAAMGGGSLWDVGTYSVSTARWMLDEEPVSVSAQAIWNEDGIDINFAGTLRFASGTLAIVESGFKSALQQTFSITGNKGAIEFAQHDAFVPAKKEEATFLIRKFNGEKGEPASAPAADQYQLMVEHFAAAVMGEHSPAVSSQDSVNQMRVLDALVTAAREERTVTL